ncbi:MAG: hypothetical protein ACPIOQ_37535, partial [Promethearchaeia archaeon]
CTTTSRASLRAAELTLAARVGKGQEGEGASSLLLAQFHFRSGNKKQCCPAKSPFALRCGLVAASAHSPARGRV